MGLLKDCQDILSGIPINPVLRERLLLAQDNEKALKDRIKALEEENAGLKEHIRNILQQGSPELTSGDYVEQAGALFKRIPGGGYSQGVYCPVCKKPAATRAKKAVVCPTCGWAWALKQPAVHTIISRLEALDKEG